jgi:hypothetical protein
VSSSLHLRTETNPVAETFCFLVFKIPDDTQSSEPQEFLRLKMLFVAHKGRIITAISIFIKENKIVTREGNCDVSVLVLSGGAGKET